MIGSFYEKVSRIVTRFEGETTRIEEPVYLLSRRVPLDPREGSLVRIVLRSFSSDVDRSVVSIFFLLDDFAVPNSVRDPGVRRGVVVPSDGGK